MAAEAEVRSTRRNNVIAYFLQSGSSRVLNSLSVAEKLIEANGIQNSKLLFQTPVLNRGLIFKDLKGLGKSSGGVQVGTKIYIPFNKNKLAEGGQTFFYDRREFNNIMAHYVDMTDPKRREALQCDVKILDVLDSLPMFAPFLLRTAFDRAEIESDPHYVAVPEDEWEEICAYIRTRFQQILTAVNGDAPVKGDSLNRLLEKLWELNDLPALQSLARAFGLPAEKCLDNFYAWKGTLYFCWSFERLQKAIFDLTSWLLEWPRLVRVYAPSQREMAKQKLQALHDDIFQQLRAVEVLLSEYERAFNDLFVHGAGPTRFIDFLSNASSRFMECGMGIGILQHAHEVWDRLTESFPNRNVNSEILDEVIDAVNGVIAKPV